MWQAIVDIVHWDTLWERRFGRLPRDDGHREEIGLRGQRFDDVVADVCPAGLEEGDCVRVWIEAGMGSKYLRRRRRRS